MKIRLVMKKLLFIIWMLVYQISGAQVRIDWQQCYGSMESDYAEGVVKTEDGYLVIGYCSQGSAGTGMVGCEDYGTGCYHINPFAYIFLCGALRIWGRFFMLR